MKEWRPSRLNLEDVLDRIDACASTIPDVLKQKPERRISVMEYLDPDWQEIVKLPNEVQALHLLYETVVNALCHHIQDDRLYVAVGRAKKLISFDTIESEGRRQRAKQYNDAMDRLAAKQKKTRGKSNGVRKVRRPAADR